jgi:signal transduction histidine kinase
MKLMPSSLFGRTLLVLAAGLLVAQAASVLINLFDRGSSVYRLAAFQIAARIGQAARILNRLPVEERSKVVEEIAGRHLRVSLAPSSVPVGQGLAEHDRYAEDFAASLQRQIGAAWPVSVDITSQPRSRRAPGEGTTATRFEMWLARHFYFLLPDTYSIIAQVGLEDGSVAVFNANIPQEPLSRLESLIRQLVLLLAVCFALAALLVRMITRSLQRLAHAADALGDDPGGAPLEPDGPSEIRRVIGAFNRMQAKVRGYVLERARILSAMSHDLRTPITRMRLRAEMLPDPDLREKMTRDLDEMETMVRSTLEFFGGLEKEPQRQPVDIGALVDSLCEDRREVGQQASVRGAPRAPYVGHAHSLRRCLDNLIENAVRYGERADIEIEDSASLLRIAVRDYGPGIPESETERVFEPFYRLEASRNRASGGTGLGLSIARNIARWHGGDVKLSNAPDTEGLIAELALPR